MASSRHEDEEDVQTKIFLRHEQMLQKITSDVSSCPFTPGRLPGQMHTQGIRGSCGGLAALDTSDFVTKSYELLTSSKEIFSWHFADLVATVGGAWKLLGYWGSSHSWFGWSTRQFGEEEGFRPRDSCQSVPLPFSTAATRAAPRPDPSWGKDEKCKTNWTSMVI